MIKSDDRRDAILDLLADHMLAAGLAGSSLRALAGAAGISDRMLLYYFADKPEIVAATLDRVGQRLVALLAASAAPTPLPFDILFPKLRATLLDDGLWPYMCLWLEIASRAAQGDIFYRIVGHNMAQGFLAWGAAQLDCPTPEARTADAARLLIMMEGTMLLKSVGMDELCQ